MWQLKKVASCIGLIILLELVKLYLKVKHPHAPSYYFFSNLLSCYQMLLLLFCAFTIISDQVLKRFFKTKFKVLSIAFFIVAVGVCELVCAYLLYHPESISKGLSLFTQYYRQVDQRIIQLDKNYSEYDSSLFYKLKRQAQFVYSNPEFSDSYRTNSQGFRDDEASLTDPAILFLGDSYTLGWGNKQEDTYPSVVERMTGLKGLNTGTSSYGTARESIVLSSLDTTHVEFIIWQYCYNDAIENKMYVDNKFVLPIRSREQYDAMVRQSSWTTAYFPGKYSLTMLNLFRQNLRKKPRDISAEKTRVAREGEEEAARFLAIVERSKINWSKTHLIVMELYHKDNASQFISSFQNLIKQDSGKRDFLKNITVLNVKPILGKEDYYILDIHLNKQGNLKVATLLANVIDSLRNKPLSK